MAKKGGAQQLQADINTDEELEKFLTRPGLLVMDVYSEWCGPCLGMVGSLKKIKLELGGDNLQLAICKSDYIESLKRFRQKSQPTWLFAKEGKAINIMFGTNVPKLMRLIADELSLLNAEDKRPFVDISEPMPEEVAQIQIKETAVSEARRIECEEADRKRHEYLMHVTDEIIANLPDMGVTMFGPQVHRDMFKKLIEPAEAQKIQCKDRRVVTVAKENFDIVNFACKNPIGEEVLKHIVNKDLLFCFWKVSEDDVRSLPSILTAYAHDLTKQQTAIGDNGEHDPSLPSYPGILSTLETKIEIKPPNNDAWLKVEAARQSEQSAAQDLVEDPLSDLLGDDQLGDMDLRDIAGLPVSEEGFEGVGEEAIGDEKCSLYEGGTLEKPEKKMKNDHQERTREDISTKTIIIPPVWAPDDHRTHAALIYVFFRQQTLGFLPPDPVPDPPHIIMAFEAYKKKDIFDLAEKHKEHVLMSGFFTSDDPLSAEIIANSLAKYDAKKPQERTDKLVIKVSKATSHTILAFASYNPTYVSPNAVIGKEDALKFFPEDFKTAEMEELEIVEKKRKQEKKKHKSKKTANSTDEADSSTIEKGKAVEEAGGSEEVDEDSEDKEDAGGNIDDEGEQSPKYLSAEAETAKTDRT